MDGSVALLAGYSPRTVRRVSKLLSLRGIDLHLGSPVIDCDDEGPSSLVLETGERIRADLVIWAAGASPPMALRGFELPKSERGFLKARRTLQTTANVPVFISGDTADIEGALVPKAGVYAVRQAPVLWKNLRRHFAGKRLVTAVLRRRHSDPRLHGLHVSQRLGLDAEELDRPQVDEAVSREVTRTAPSGLENGCATSF